MATYIFLPFFPSSLQTQTKNIHKSVAISLFFFVMKPSKPTTKVSVLSPTITTLLTLFQASYHHRQYNLKPQPSHRHHHHPLPINSSQSLWKWIPKGGRGWKKIRQPHPPSHHITPHHCTNITHSHQRYPSLLLHFFMLKAFPWLCLG